MHGGKLVCRYVSENIVVKNAFLFRYKIHTYTTYVISTKFKVRAGSGHLLCLIPFCMLGVAVLCVHRYVAEAEVAAV